MKTPKSNPLVRVGALVLACTSAASLHAANLSWDQTGGGALGGTGTWNTSNTNWWDGASDVAWTTNTISGDTAVFGGTAGTVTLGSAINALGLTFNTTGYTIAGSTFTLSLGTGGIDASALSSGTTTISGGGATGVSLGAAQSWNVGSGATLAVSSVIGGSGALSKDGSGSLTLSGANTFNGGLTINAGTVTSTANAGFGAGAVTIGASGAATITLGANGNVTNAFSGSGILNVTGSFTPTLTSTTALNSFTGTLNVNTTSGGKFAMNGTGSNIGSGAIVNIASGATLYLPVASTINGVTFNLAGAGNTEGLGALRLENGTTIGATSSIVATGNTQLGHNGNSTASTINAVISETGGSRSIEKVGSGTMVFAGNNTYTGATILTAGTLSVSTDTAGAYNLGGSGTNGITFNGGTLRITGTTITNFGSHTPTFTATKLVSLDIAAATNNFTISQVLDQTTGGLNKAGAGTLTLSNANTFTGAVTVAGGTLVVSNQMSGTNTSNAQFKVGTVSGTGATLKITDGANITNRHNLFVGDAGAGTGGGAVYQSGGTLTLNQGSGIDNLRIGSNAGGYGYYKLSGGALTANEVGIGASLAGTTGVMDVTGGTMSVAGNGWITIGRGGTTSSGLLNVTGGTVTATRIHLNFAATSGATSVLNVGGGAGAAAVSTTGSATLGLDLANANNTGTIAAANLLTNGTLTTGIVTASQANPTTLLNFNGGTLKATATNAGANFLTSANVDAVTVYSNGGTIDNSGTSITVGKALGAATGNGVSSIAVTSGGSGYIGAPMVKFTDGTGNPATGYAVMVDDGTGNGTFKVDSIVITSPGTYSVDPTTVTLTGGAGSGATLGTISTSANTGGGMTFTGSGTTTISGANTYTGATTVSGGTLALGSATTLQSATGNVNVSGGTLSSTVSSSTLGGNLNVSGGSLASINGASAGNFTLASGKDFTMTSGTWTLDLATLDSIVGGGTGSQFTLSGGTFALSNVSQGTFAVLTGFDGSLTNTASGISFTGLAGNQFASLNISGGTLNLVVVPEPQEYAIAIAGLLAVMVIIRRRRAAGVTA